MPSTLNETTVEQAARLVAELQAVEELWKKQALLWKAMEEAQEADMREWEEALAKAEATRRAQEEPELQGTLGVGPFF